MKNEIEAVQRLQVDHEKVVLDAWHQLENAQELLAKRNRESADVLQQLDADIGALVQEKQMFDGELSDIHMQRESKKVGIPEEWLEKYNVMGQRVANPVVAIEHQSCGGCYQQLVAQDLIKARRGALLQCKKCFRLLYLPEMMQQSDSVGTAEK
jgi:predicted  nucleic acid-binding Zn-ribbon protein